MRNLKLFSVFIIMVFFIGSLQSPFPEPIARNQVKTDNTINRQMAGSTGSPSDVWERQFSLRDYARIQDTTPAVALAGWSFTPYVEVFNATGTASAIEKLYWLSTAENTNVTWVFTGTVNHPTSSASIYLWLGDHINGYRDATYTNWFGRVLYQITYNSFVIKSFTKSGSSTQYTGSFTISDIQPYILSYYYVDVNSFKTILSNYNKSVIYVNETVSTSLSDKYDFRGVDSAGVGFQYTSTNSSKCQISVYSFQPVNLYNTKVGQTSSLGCDILWEEYVSTVLLYHYSVTSYPYYRKWINYTYTSTFLTINAMQFILNLFTTNERIISTHTFYGDEHLFLKTSISQSERTVIGVNVEYRTQFQIWNSSNVRVLNSTMGFMCWANETVIPYIMAWIYHDPVNPSVMTEQIQYGYLYYRQSDDLWIYLVFQTLHIADTWRFSHLSQYIEYTSSTIGLLNFIVVDFENRLKIIQQMVPDPSSSQAILNYKGVSEQLGYSTESVDYTVWVSETFKQGIEKWGLTLEKALQALSIAIGLGVGSIIAGLSGGFDSIILGLGNLLAGITIAFANVITFFGDFLSAIVSGDIWTAIGTVLGSFGAALAGFGQFMVDVITAIPDFVVGFASLIQMAIGFIVQALDLVVSVVVMIIPWIAMIIVFDLIAYTVKMAEGEGPGVLLDWAMRYVHILSFVFNIIATVVRSVIHVVQMVVNIV